MLMYTSGFEMIPRLSPSYLPFVAADINRFASERNMKLTEKKCKKWSLAF